MKIENHYKGGFTMTFKNEYELTAKYSTQKSFYGKARVLLGTDGKIYLESYDTIVAVCDNGVVELVDYYSRTTGKHQREFIAQFDTTGRDWATIRKDSGATRSAVYDSWDYLNR